MEHHDRPPGWLRIDRGDLRGPNTTLRATQPWAREPLGATARGAGAKGVLVDARGAPHSTLASARALVWPLRHLALAVGPRRLSCQVRVGRSTMAVQPTYATVPRLPHPTHRTCLGLSAMTEGMRTREEERNEDRNPSMDADQATEVSLVSGSGAGGKEEGPRYRSAFHVEHPWEARSRWPGARGARLADAHQGAGYLAAGLPRDTASPSRRSRLLGNSGPATWNPRGAELMDRSPGTRLPDHIAPGIGHLGIARSTWNIRGKRGVDGRCPGARLARAPGAGYLAAGLPGTQPALPADHGSWGTWPATWNPRRGADGPVPRDSSARPRRTRDRAPRSWSPSRGTATSPCRRSRLLGERSAVTRHTGNIRAPARTNRLVPGGFRLPDHVARGIGHLAAGCSAGGHNQPFLPITALGERRQQRATRGNRRGASRWTGSGGLRSPADGWPRVVAILHGGRPTR